MEMKHLILIGGAALIGYFLLRGSGQTKNEGPVNAPTVTPAIIPPVISTPTSNTVYDVDVAAPDLPAIPEQMMIDIQPATPESIARVENAPTVGHTVAPDTGSFQNVPVVQEILAPQQDPDPPRVVDPVPIQEVTARPPSTGIQILDRVAWGGL